MGQETLAEAKRRSQLPKCKSSRASSGPPQPSPGPHVASEKTRSRAAHHGLLRAAPGQAPALGSPLPWAASPPCSAQEIWKPPFRLLVHPGTYQSASLHPYRQMPTSQPHTEGPGRKKKGLLFYLNQGETKPVTKFAPWDGRALNAISHVENVGLRPPGRQRKAAESIQAHGGGGGALMAKPGAGPLRRP